MRKNRKRIKKSQPVDQVKPKGEFPSRANQWKTGQSGNPNGRPAVGATITEWMNVLGYEDLAEDELRRIVKDKKVGWTKRSAAIQCLRNLEVADMADYQDLCDGVSDLKALRTSGVNTEAIKKMKVKTRTYTPKDSEPVTETEREIELYDRIGEHIDRVLDRTQGRPTQRSEVSAAVVSHQSTDEELLKRIAADPSALDLANNLARHLVLHTSGNGEQTVGSEIPVASTHRPDKQKTGADCSQTQPSTDTPSSS